MPRGRAIDRQLQLSLMRTYESNDELEPWEDRYSVRELARLHGVGKSTVHRYVNQDALNADRRRSARRRERIRRTGRR